MIAFEFEQACHVRTLYEDFCRCSMLSSETWLVFFFFLLLNNIFGTVYLISFNLFILYTVLYILFF